jgi:hypothetical protein
MTAAKKRDNFGYFIIFTNNFLSICSGKQLIS